MWIELDKSIFEEEDNLQDVNYLLGIFSHKRRYDFFVDISVVENTALYKSLLSINKDLIEQYFNRFINESLEENHVITHITSDTSFNLREAISFFNQPLSIILENKFNDGYFLDALIANFRGKSRKIRRHKKNRWLKYEHGGGSTIKQVIEAEKNTFENLPKPNEIYLRYFVLIDSDKKFPTNDLKNEIKQLLEYLKENNIPYHILEKREIENYLPEKVLEDIKNSLPDKVFKDIGGTYIDAYLSLTPEQKDYFDIEKGFNNKNFPSLAEEVKEHFGTLEESEYFKVFRKPRDYINASVYKSEFPKYFEKATQESLKKRVEHQDNPDELEEILERITKLL